MWIILAYILLYIVFYCQNEILHKPIESSIVQQILTEHCIDPGIRNFDYFVFSQIWSTSYCLVEHGKCLQNRIKPYFTIHGLWPTLGKSYHGYWWPQCCNSSYIDFDKIYNNNYNNFEFYWVNILKENNKYDFWIHEWNKHGSCSNFDPKNYFSKTIDIRKKINIIEMLKESGVFPSNYRTYQRSEIENAIIQNIHAKPTIVCREFRNYSLITEVQLCLDKELKNFIDCIVESKCSNIIHFPQELEEVRS